MAGTQNQFYHAVHRMASFTRPGIPRQIDVVGRVSLPAGPGPGPAEQRVTGRVRAQGWQSGWAFRLEIRARDSGATDDGRIAVVEGRNLDVWLLLDAARDRMVNLMEMREYGIVVSFKHEVDLRLTRCGTM